MDIVGTYPYTRETYDYSAGTGNLISKSGVGNDKYPGFPAHAVTRAGQNMYEYDDNGNITYSSAGNTHYVYDLFNNLVVDEVRLKVIPEDNLHFDFTFDWEDMSQTILIDTNKINPNSDCFGGFIP